MANERYIRCTKCGTEDYPVRAIVSNGKILQPHNIGTSTKMRCFDCGETRETGANPPYATMCRNCCPTGHGTC